LSYRSNNPSGAEPESDAQRQFNYMLQMEKLQRELEDKQLADFLANNPGYDGPRDLGLVAQYYGMQAEAAQQKEAALLAAARSGDINAVRQYAAMHGGLIRYEGAAAKTLFNRLYTMEEARVAKQGINITVTNQIVGDYVVKGYPNQVYDAKGKRVVYKVPLYNVIVTGNIGGKNVTRTYQAIRYGVYNSETRGPNVIGINSGTFTGEWGTMGCCGEAIHIVGAGNNDDAWIHIGPSQNYAPGAINCVLIFGANGSGDEWNRFTYSIFEMGGGDRREAGLPISITFQPAQPPALVPIYNSTFR